MSLEERIAALEDAMNRSNAHASHMQGTVGLLGFLSALDIMGRVLVAENPYQAMQVYINTVVQNGRKLHAPPGEWHECCTD